MYKLVNTKPINNPDYKPLKLSIKDLEREIKEKLKRNMKRKTTLIGIQYLIMKWNQKFYLVKKLEYLKIIISLLKRIFV